METNALRTPGAPSVTRVTAVGLLVAQLHSTHRGGDSHGDSHSLHTAHITFVLAVANLSTFQASTKVLENLEAHIDNRSLQSRLSPGWNGHSDEREHF